MKTIKIPTTDGIVEVSGDVVILPIGETKQKFLIHTLGLSPDLILTHYKSGKRIGRLVTMEWCDDIKPRQAAINLIGNLVNQHGVDRLIVVMHSAETVNS